jgi:uncharacterized protein
MAATAVRNLILQDPAQIWLEHYGHEHGFEPSQTPYDLLSYLAEQSARFEQKWLHEVTPGAIQVCQHGWEVRSFDQVKRTFQLMVEGVPVIAQPALWWAPERIYGIPDFIVHSTWLARTFPGLRKPDLATPHYLVVDLKFTGLQRARRDDITTHSAQVRLYSYMLGALQGYMPRQGYLVARDRIAAPLIVPITSTLNEPLDKDLAEMRDHYAEIVTHGASYLPWRDALVETNVNNADGRWQKAKEIIAWKHLPGGDPGVLPYIGLRQKRQLAELGYPTLESMLAVDPADIPLEKCQNLGPTVSPRIRAILRTNQEGTPIAPARHLVPQPGRYEFFVDLEYLSNLHVDIEAQWPNLLGREMIFMIGVGWEQDGCWHFKSFTAAQETTEHELAILLEFLQFLDRQTNGVYLDPSQTALYHWSNAEVWQSRNAARRHNLPEHHPIRRLPWFDLEQQVALKAPIAVPGAWNYRLKTLARALGQIDPALDPAWPGNLDQGQQAMVMGWRAYESDHPLESAEMQLLREYLDADCRAVWKILTWMRSAE